MIEDSEIVEQARSGDANAFAELVRRYQLDVRAFLRRRLNDVSLADDLAQEVFLGAIKSISGFRKDSSVRGWLLSIARYKLVDHIRAESRKRNAQTQLEEDLLAESVRRLDHEQEIDEGVLQSLKDCMSRLQPNARRLLQDFYFDRIEATAIAKQNNQKPSAVRMNLLRIRRALGKCIRKTMGESFEL